MYVPLYNNAASVAAAPVPRGIVTATTVPRGTVPVVHQQQPPAAPIKPQISSHPVPSKAIHPSPVSHSVATPTSSVTIATATSTSGGGSQPASVPNVLSQKAARDLHAQLVALQHSAGTQQLSPELLAQVHSLLNLSSSLVHTSDSGCEEGDGTPQLDADISATQATSLTTSPRCVGEPGEEKVKYFNANCSFAGWKKNCPLPPMINIKGSFLNIHIFLIASASSCVFMYRYSFIS